MPPRQLMAAQYINLPSYYSQCTAMIAGKLWRKKHSQLTALNIAVNHSEINFHYLNVRKFSYVHTFKYPCPCVKKYTVYICLNSKKQNFATCNQRFLLVKSLNEYKN